MTKSDLRIVYLGTPEFAVAGLRALVEGGYNVVAVVTMPDKPAGRGHQMQFSDVKRYALEVGLPVLQPEPVLLPEPQPRRAPPPRPRRSQRPPRSPPPDHPENPADWKSAPDAACTYRTVHA